MKAQVIRGVRIRDHKSGVTNAHAPGETVNVTPQEYAELKASNYVVAAPEDVPIAPPIAQTTGVGPFATSGSAGASVAQAKTSEKK